MYQPPHFRVEDRAELVALIRAHPLAQLITAGPGGLNANPIPFLAVEEGGALILRAHVARANPLWRDVAAGAEVLAIFQSLDHYVTPSWYATKRETGKVVPTWNYKVVQARGPASVHETPQWLRPQLDALTAQQEPTVGSDWAVSDAPAEFVEAQMRGIVGIEIAVSELIGKFKLSQNRNEADRTGVADGLEGAGNDQARAMSEEMRLFPKIG